MVKENLYRALYYISLIVGILIYMGCKESSTVQPSGDNDSCGTGTNRSMIYTRPFTGNWPPYTYTLGSQRYFDFYIEIDSICTDKHVNIRFSATAVNVPGRPINFVGAIEWYILWERRESGEITINGEGNREWSAEIPSLGFKQQYGENPANCFMNIYVDFPTLGSLAQDSVFLRENVIIVDGSFDYHLHKFTTDNASISPKNYKNFPLAQNTNRKELFTNIPVESYRSNKKLVTLAL